MFNLFYAYVWIISERYIENLVISIWTKVHQIQILKNIKNFQSSRIYVLFIKVKESFKVEDGKKKTFVGPKSIIFKYKRIDLTFRD